MKYKIVPRILAALAAFLLIGFILAFINSFFGNPISAAIATSKIKAYAEKTYPELDLSIPKAGYNFKNTEYFSKVQSKISVDTCFNIGYSSSKIYDTYEYEVANKFTTYRRLTDDFNTEVEALLSKEFPYKTSIVIADYEKDESDLSSLTLDMPFDISSPPLKTYLTVYTSSEEISYEVLGQRLLELHKLMGEHHIPINVYSFVLEEPNTLNEKPADGEKLYLLDFPVEKISENNLVETIAQHQKQWEQDHDKDNKN